MRKICLILTLAIISDVICRAISTGFPKMNDSKFFQWLGYLSNPSRRSDIHVECHPDKAHEFRDEYRTFTGQSLLLDGTGVPFYVWKPGANKWGVQRRIYFYGDWNYMPDPPAKINVRAGRTPNQWRINNKDFIPELFKYGFLIGKNTYCANNVRERINAQDLHDFNLGYNKMSPVEQANRVILQNYVEHGMRTQQISDIQNLCQLSHKEMKKIIKNLCAQKAANINNTEDALTLIFNPDEIIKNEVEDIAAQQAIYNEKHVEKREYLIETYARDRGWKKMAKKIFGTKCMCENCTNSFVKEDGEPYIEVHHIIPLHQKGEDGIWNLSVLCAHHHRMAHFARKNDKKKIKEHLLEQNHKVRNNYSM